MKSTLPGIVLLLVAGFISLATVQAQQPAKEVPGLPIDSAFEKATTTKQLDEALLNHVVYKKAIREALQAKKEAEDRRPGVVGPSPARAARIRFLQVLDAKE